MVKTALICGIDEAGRGPVIGPLVMAGILIKESDLSKLKKLGVKDSKLLSSQKREQLFEKIKKLALSHKIEILSPEKIDAALKSDNSNLNWLEADTSASIVNELKPNEVIIDCPSVNISSYQDYLSQKLSLEAKTNLKMIIEHKADVNYLAVAAASILAKVTRDREIEKIKKELKIDFGSGYLADEKTQEFLKNNFNNKLYSQIFRTTWQPYQEFVKNQSQKKLGEF